MDANTLIRALTAAKQDGNEEAAEELRQMLAATYQSEVPSPLEGMSDAEKYAANWSAGVRQLGRGAMDLVGLRSDEDVAESRARDQELADSVRGGGAVQLAGNIAPTLAIPYGAVTKGLSAIPRVGAAIKAAGVGTRVLPTMMAEGVGTGAMLGALRETGEGESRVMNTATGAVGGAVVPAALGAAGALGRRLLPSAVGGERLGERAVGRRLAGAVGDDLPDATRRLQQFTRGAQQGLDVPPASTAMVTQNAELAAMELADRALPRSQRAWAAFDEALDNARWDILDRRLGSATTLEAAREATEEFANREIPRIFARVRPAKFTQASQDFTAGLRRELLSPTNIADPAARRVFAHIASTESKLKRAGGGWTPATLWKERQTLSAWLNGTPPSGKVEVRAPKMDHFIMEARNAIDATLNRATDDAWTPFLQSFGERLSAETRAKAGMNIRNVFFDDALTVPRGGTTAAGNPKVTRAAMQKAYSKFGSNKFGPTLDTDADDAARTVVDSLNAQEVLQRAKSTMTGRGGSQTTPLALRVAQESTGSNGAFMEIAQSIARYASHRDQQLMTRALEDPQFALRLLQSGQAQLSPIARRDLALIAASQRVALPVAANELAN